MSDAQSERSSRPLHFVAVGHTDVGLQREINEDAFCILSKYNLFLVADGMGGHQAGDVASRTAMHAIAEFFEHTASEDGTWPFSFDPYLSFEENRLVTGLKVANRRIFELSMTHREMHGMGTTVVGALYAPQRGRLYIANVGDSRAYRIRDGQIVQLTRDHSLVNEHLMMLPELTEEQLQELPRNVITRALGMHEDITVDLVHDEPRPGDRYLLCSDGLSGMVPDAAILRIVEECGEDIELAVQRLIEAANAAGGEDNITVVCVLFLEGEPLGPPPPTVMAGGTALDMALAELPDPTGPSEG